jgi:hypothetical protein
MLSPIAKGGQNIMGNNMTPNRNIPNQYGSPIIQTQPMAPV